MDDEFLHRLRRDPPAGFAARLKRQLDRPVPVRPSRTHLIFGLAIFGTAFALTASPVRHTIAEWFSTRPGTPPRTAASPRNDSSATAGPAAGIPGSPPAPPSVRPAPRRLAASPIAPTPGSTPPAAAQPIAAEPVPAIATSNPPVSLSSSILIAPDGPRAAAAVATRQGLFRLLAFVMQPLTHMAQDAVPFDEQRVAQSADRLQQLAPLIPEVFKSDTHTVPDDFAAKAEDLTDAANVLATAAATGDRDAALKAIAQIDAACGACHANYLKK
jgi:cytochrome c556